MLLLLYIPLYHQPFIKLDTRYAHCEDACQLCNYHSNLHAATAGRAQRSLDDSDHS